MVGRAETSVAFIALRAIRATRLSNAFAKIQKIFDICKFFQISVIFASFCLILSTLLLLSFYSIGVVDVSVTDDEELSINNGFRGCRSGRNVVHSRWGVEVTDGIININT